MIAWLKQWLGTEPEPQPEPQRAPHERWPEILHWQEGDEFDSHKHYLDRLVTLRSDGTAVVAEAGHRTILHECWVGKLVGHNASYRTRRISQEIQQDDHYMELLREFNRAVRELEARDRRNGIKIA